MNRLTPRMSVTTIVARFLACVTFVATLSLSAVATAQVVVVVNGLPITELDIAQRSKLLATMNHKSPTRQEVINELIDDRIKIAKAKFYGFELTDTEVNDAFGNMAKQQNISPQQFAQMLERGGITADALKARIKAEMTWQQLIRSRYSSSLQIGESDLALATKTDEAKAGDNSVGYIYTLYPVVVIIPSGSSTAVTEAKRREADNLRGRFQSCSSGLALARALRDVAVRDPITRNSADLSPRLREMLASLEIGHLTTPDDTPQGLQMFALCEKKTSTADSPAKNELRQKLYLKRFETESKKFLAEIRKQAMIEYK
jgi:peptidyl-prolyl cis-trans isomerase SurA